jgi:hypothetical protein
VTVVDRRQHDALERRRVRRALARRELRAQQALVGLLADLAQRSKVLRSKRRPRPKA